CAGTGVAPPAHRPPSPRCSVTSPVSQATSTFQAASRRLSCSRPPVEAPSPKNTIAPTPSRGCTSRAPVKRTSSVSGNVPPRPFAPCQVRDAGSMVNRCGTPVAMAWARAKRSCAAISFAPERSAMRSKPPLSTPAASSPVAAISAITSSSSSSENPRGAPRGAGVPVSRTRPAPVGRPLATIRPGRRTPRSGGRVTALAPLARSACGPARTARRPDRSPSLVADIRVDAGAARLAVGAIADDVERPAVARDPILEGRVPRIAQFGRPGIRPEPADRAAGLDHQLFQRGRQRAGVHLELLHLLGQRLHLGFGQPHPRALAAAQDESGGEGGEAADQRHHEDDLDKREAALAGPRRARAQALARTGRIGPSVPRCHRPGAAERAVDTDPGAPRARLAAASYLYPQSSHVRLLESKSATCPGACLAGRAPAAQRGNDPGRLPPPYPITLVRS